MEQRIPVILFARDSSVQSGRRVVQTITLSWRSSVCRRNREEQNEHPGRPSRKGSPGIDDKGLHRPFVAFGNSGVGMLPILRLIGPVEFRTRLTHWLPSAIQHGSQDHDRSEAVSQVKTQCIPFFGD